MKIIHVITGLGDGGAEGVLYRLCTNSPDSHHVVSLMDEGKYGPLLSRAGVRVSCIGMPRGKVTLRGLRRLRQIIATDRSAVVQTWMYHADLMGGIASRLARNRRIVWNIRHTNLEPAVTSRSTRFVASIAALLSRIIPVAIVACAEAARLSHAAFGYDASKMVVIPNGYDLSTFRPRPTSVGSDAEVLPTIGMVARFSPQKDHNNLFQALRLLIDRGVHLRCLLVGTGVTPNNPELQRMISALGLEEHVALLGPRADIPDFLTSIDLHVLPSNDEGFPNVVAEAMACGTPCVTTDVGDAAMIVGETGWIVPPRSPVLLADAIANAIRERTTRRGDWELRRQSASSRIERMFSLASMVSAYRAVWRSVM